MTEDSNKEQFIYPKESYRGEFKLEHVAFNANLQEFAKKVNIICNLETNGKITSNDAYQRIKELWRQLKSSRKTLKVPDQEDLD
ncbi:hypothetical protein [[Limnothrix rosea] IAM M-220]|uniref:DUF7219 family protein n=1 Tax=[Limnothrix rosea] IAM M-220 TaxID=454133 RepID=UPI0009617238|nr:hypothetical protein [[Limnothrix rosea] IAM M-220]OKH17088.1 hypothetical protein NIES208_10885 [[Limnothrix rosea] IAM M-220]